jgi:DNA-binding winged helix-turn-helix (wHTH) protein/tetratricopeptide (TPR) repeat protein
VIYAFGEHELDAEGLALRRAGRQVDLQPKALELLFFLVGNRERAVSKREILDALWPGTAVTDNSVARAVRLARVAIDDRCARSIVTVPRRGYRFAAPVRTLEAASADDAAAQRYVGRVGLLERLGETVDRALRGSGRVVLLVGEAGIGKTRTAEVLAERARGAGALVAAAWGPDGVAPAWTRVLQAVASAVPEALSGLAPDVRVDLASLLPERNESRPRAAPMSAESARFRLFEAVAQLLTRAATRRPLALVLDDLHAADVESLRLLEFVGQALRPLPIAIVATCREEDAGRTPQQARALERLLRLTSLERWPLVGLHGSEVREFVRLRIGADPDPELLTALERKTRGNPLLLGESLRSLEALGLLQATRGTAEWEELLPAGIQHLLQPKLRQLSPRALELVSAASAIGLEFERTLLERCAPNDVDEGLPEALNAGILQASASSSRLRFTHVLVRESLYAELVPPGPARRALHARIVAALDAAPGGSGESVTARAHHACESVPLVDPARAAALAQAAGEAAARLHDFERAAEWHARALATLEVAPEPDPTLVAGLLIRLGDAQARTLGLERARIHFQRAADLARRLGRGDLLGDAALGLAQGVTATSGDVGLVAVLEEAERVVPVEHRALRIRLRSRLAGELRDLDPARAGELVDSAVADARVLGDSAVLSRALEDCIWVRWRPDDPELWVELHTEMARSAIAAGDLELALIGQRARVTGFLELGDGPSADREISACERTAQALRTPFGRWVCAGLHAMRALLDGDLAAAEPQVLTAMQLAEGLDAYQIALQAPAQIVYLRLEQGRAAEIEPGAREMVRRYPREPVWRAGFARVLVAAGRSAEAREELGRLAQARFEDLRPSHAWLMTLALAAEVASATGEVQICELLEPLLLRCARMGVMGGAGLLYYGPVEHHLGLVALAQSHWDAAIGHFEAARRVEEACAARAWRARTQLACARAWLGRGETGRARAARLVADASATARALSLVDVAATATQLTSQIWPRRGAPRTRRDAASES